MLRKSIFFGLFLLVLTFLNSCTSQNKSVGQTVSSTAVSDLDSLSKPTIELINYPEDFLIQNELEDWETYKDLHQALERLKDLNFDGIEVDLIALTTRVKRLRTGSIPRKLNTPQITSRLKVVEMQIMKARYFTKYYKQDSLLPAVELVYEYYNDFVKRMVSLQEETQSLDDSEEVVNP